MSDPEVRYQKIISKLHERGFRLTSHRLALARLLALSLGHPNATQLFETLKRQFPTISLATIYKTLALLKDEGEVLEIDLRTDSRYDGNKPFPHPHLICNRCNKIIDGDELIGLTQLKDEVESQYHFQISRHQLIYFGLCEECQSMDQ